MALIDDFKAQFPEFDATEVDNGFPIIEALWPALYNREYEQNQQPVLYLLAHLFVTQVKKQSSSNPARMLESKSAGSVSGSYAKLKNAPDATEEWYRTTRYGQLFLLLTAHQAQGGVPV